MSKDYHSLMLSQERSSCTQYGSLGTVLSTQHMREWYTKKGSMREKLWQVSSFKADLPSSLSYLSWWAETVFSSKEWGARSVNIEKEGKTRPTLDENGHCLQTSFRGQGPTIMK